jgi:hypothetical protein
MHTRSYPENLKERDHLEYLDVKMRKIGCEGVDWIRLAQDRVEW